MQCILPVQKSAAACWMKDSLVPFAMLSHPASPAKKMPEKICAQWACAKTCRDKVLALITCLSSKWCSDACFLFHEYAHLINYTRVDPKQNVPTWNMVVMWNKDTRRQVTKNKPVRGKRQVIRATNTWGPKPPSLTTQDRRQYPDQETRSKSREPVVNHHKKIQKACTPPQSTKLEATGDKRKTKAESLQGKGQRQTNGNKVKDNAQPCWETN